MIQLSRCAVCNSPLREQINARIAKGVPGAVISRWLRSEDAYISVITLRKHRKLHLTSEIERERAAAAKMLEAQSKTLTPTKGVDLAALVRDNVTARVETGALEPTVSEGLRAQELLDRRAEKGADRSLALRFAAVISGAFIVPDAIEGDYREIDPALPGLPGGD